MSVYVFPGIKCLVFIANDDITSAPPSSIIVALGLNIFVDIAGLAAKSIGDITIQLYIIAQ